MFDIYVVGIKGETGRVAVSVPAVPLDGTIFDVDEALYKVIDVSWQIMIRGVPKKRSALIVVSVVPVNPPT